MNPSSSAPKPPKPRDFLIAPGSFGRKARVQWDDDLRDKFPEHALAARWQHALALYARVALDDAQRMTHEAFAALLGKKTQYVSQRLSGHQPMDLLDAAHFHTHLGVNLIRPDADLEVPVDMRRE